mmetsp:Transcript_14775/g.2456  ORF Transcript_14775/g.2456 Transcript_14775/m.2456 type:complete len:83 (-) Transcript_14775:1135-1383(-)
MMTGNLKVIWALINSIQILAFIPLTNVSLTTNLSEFFAAILHYSIIPNAFAYVIYEEGSPRNELSERNGYGTNQYLLGCGNL